MSVAILGAALPIAEAVFDSLWEGVLIAGVVWLCLRCVPSIGAASRCAIWLCALMALVGIPVLTVILDQPAPAVDAFVVATPSFGTPAPVRAPSGPAPGALRHAHVAPAAAPAGAAAPAAPSARRISIAHAVAVGTALMWLLVTCVRGFALLLAMLDLWRLRGDARAWSADFEYPVLLSDRVRVPLAIGFLRPAILLPTALTAQLPPDAIAGIITHELAHLSRGDVWTNGLARVAHAVVAFNPAAWFVLRQLSIEREIACDDWVVTRTGSGDAFAGTLLRIAGMASGRIPLVAASAFQSRHSLVLRVERLLDSRPRRLRLSPAALGGTVMLLAVVAYLVQSVSPVLAYEPPQPTPAPTSLSREGTACTVPTRPLRLAYIYGPGRYGPKTPPMDRELPSEREAVAKFGATRVATFDLTVDAAGVPRKVVILTAPRYPGIVEHLTRLLMTSTYSPALRDCVPVAATVRAGVPLQPPEPNTGSVIVPVYGAGWSDRHPAACKVPTVTHARYRPGFVAGTAYTDMLPAIPDTMKTMDIDAKYHTSVRVRVDAAGRAISVSLARSSGQPAFDESALVAARHATYPLTVSTCKPLPSEYVWDTTFAMQAIP